jgi:serine/threonine protein kinase
MMIFSYEVCQELSGNDSFLLCRGRSREDGRPVLLKTPRHDPPSPFEVRLLEHEYAILQGLSLSGVLRAHALLRDGQGWCLVLEDRGGVPLPMLRTSRRLDLDTFFALALQLATILAELHRCNIIHQHLTPWSILVHPTTGEVCLTDFSRAARTVSELQVENVYLQEEIRQEHNFEEMVGSSPALLEMLQTVEIVAPTDTTVLLYGETGTGKELIARALPCIIAAPGRIGLS